MASERFDVIIIGAGLSGIGAARYLKTRLPQKSFAILETKSGLYTDLVIRQDAAPTNLPRFYRVRYSP
jgi:cation diffusion facilitator CzcD-associated flavoprotein CzcO